MPILIRPITTLKEERAQPAVQCATLPRALLFREWHRREALPVEFRRRDAFARDNCAGGRLVALCDGLPCRACGAALCSKVCVARAFIDGLWLAVPRVAVGRDGPRQLLAGAAAGKADVPGGGTAPQQQREDYVRGISEQHEENNTRGISEEQQRNSSNSSRRRTL